MTSIKIYTATPADLSPPVQSESFCVDLVLASDYRELEAKCVALTAENVGLNKFIKDDCWIWDDKSEEYFDAADCMPETPATDAFLAEMRAQGVDEIAELYFTLAAHEANRNIADSWRESARFARAYGAQLRQGAAL